MISLHSCLKIDFLYARRLESMYYSACLGTYNELDYSTRFRPFTERSVHVILVYEGQDCHWPFIGVSEANPGIHMPLSHECTLATIGVSHRHLREPRLGPARPYNQI